MEQAKVLTVPMRNGNFQKLRELLKELFVLTVPMRNGNFKLINHFLNLTIPFLPYLWGMETEKFVNDMEIEGEFLPYLWGMETAVGNSLSYTGQPSSYRTYEEWKLEVINSIVNVIKGSYRTYEEWKLVSSSVLPLSSAFVLTVPMRNGNQTMHDILQKVGEFLPYLWGMETRYLCHRIAFSNYVLTVPMRNGNRGRNLCKVLTFLSSYRTYEEWKPLDTISSGRWNEGSYRTYEEWKPIYVKDADNGVVGSYRTYEEWKLLSKSLIMKLGTMFLPYLWGMETR